MSKLGITLNLLIVFSTIVLILSPEASSKIVGSGTAVPVSVGGGTGTVTSISEGQGVLINPNPLTTTGIISLRNATQLLIGGINVFNCTGNGHISGFFANMTPFCSDNNGNGTITSIDNGEGIVVNPDPITTTGFIMGANATTSARGIVQVANCTGTDKVSGWGAGNVPTCSTDSTGSGGGMAWTLVANADGAGFLCSNCPVAGTEFFPINIVNMSKTTQVRVVAFCDVACDGDTVVEVINDADNSVIASVAGANAADTAEAGTCTTEALSGDINAKVRIKGTGAAAEDYRITHVQMESC